MYHLRRFDSNSLASQKKKYHLLCVSLTLPCVTRRLPLDQVMNGCHHKTLRRQVGFATVWESARSSVGESATEEYLAPA